MSAPYSPLYGLPPLAGVATFAEAQKPGLSVEECVKRLKRYHYALKRLHEILLARLTAEPVYELKMAFSLHAHYCAEHVTALRQRVGEMREPPLGLEIVPDTQLAIFFDEILGAPSREELLLGVYEKALPAVIAALDRHLAETNPLVDHPSVRVCRFALLELREAEAFGTKAVARLVSAEQRKEFAPWLALLDDCLAAAGSLDGASAGPLARQEAASPDTRRGPSSIAERPHAMNASPIPTTWESMPRRFFTIRKCRPSRRW